VKEAAL